MWIAEIASARVAALAVSRDFPYGSVRPNARIFRGELSLDAQRSHRTRRPPHPRMNRKAISGAPVEGALSEGGVVMDAVLVRDEIGSASDDA